MTTSDPHVSSHLRKVEHVKDSQPGAQFTVMVTVVVAVIAPLEPVAVTV